MGTLSDEGAAALLASDSIRQLNTLNVSHHYMSQDMQDRIGALSPVNVLVGDSRIDPDDEDYRYVSVGE